MPLCSSSSLLQVWQVIRNHLQSKLTSPFPLSKLAELEANRWLQALSTWQQCSWLTDSVLFSCLCICWYTPSPHTHPTTSNPPRAYYTFSEEIWPCLEPEQQVLLWHISDHFLPSRLHVHTNVTGAVKRTENGCVLKKIKLSYMQTHTLWIF